MANSRAGFVSRASQSVPAKGKIDSGGLCEDSLPFLTKWSPERSGTHTDALHFIAAIVHERVHGV